MDRHGWTMPARGAAAHEVKWRADATGLWMDGVLIGFPEASREILRLAEEVERLKAAASPTSTLAVGKAILDERARIRREWEAFSAQFKCHCTKSCEEYDDLKEDDFLAALDRICPGED